MVTPTLAETPRPAPAGGPEPPSWRWGHYEVLEFLGRGGMSHVYKAYDRRLKRHVAIKFLHGSSHQDSLRFVREAQAQARVDHPHVCKVYGVGQVAGSLYIAMQLVEGGRLQAVGPRLALDERVRVMRTVAEGIHAAHRLGLIHRDVKPGNVLVEATEDGYHPYVLDFGIARELGSPGLTRTGIAVGTPWYMAPEQLLGGAGKLGPAIDVYGLGATLYELLSGARPVEGESPPEVVCNILEAEPVPLRRRVPRLPRDLETITMKCLEKEAGRRYASARELADDLGRFLAGEPVAAQPPTMTYRVGKTLRRHRPLVATAAVALLLVGGFAFNALQSRLQSARRAELAQRLGQEVERMEWLQLSAHQLPLHDVRPQHESIRRRIAEIAARVKDAGPDAAGPGAYAMGRGHLALQEHEAARAHLEKAWQSGYRRPEVAYALGTVYGELYQRALETEELMGDEDTRALRRQRLEEEYLQPARSYLEHARGAEVAPPELVEARLALYQGHPDLAVAKALEAVEAVPWLYEAHRVRADALYTRAVNERESGAYDAALTTFGEVEDALDAGLLIGRSDPASLLRAAEVLNRQLEIVIFDSEEEARALHTRVLEACERALVADPSSDLPHLERAASWSIWAEFRGWRGQDPTEPALAMIEATEEALALDPGRARSLRFLGMARGYLARYAVHSGRDPSAFTHQAVLELERALQILPGSTRSFNQLAQIHLTQAEWLRDQGLDPTASLAAAQEALTGGLAIEPKHITNLGLMGNAALLQASWQALHGDDPRPAVKRAKEAFEGCLALNPNQSWTYNNLSLGYSWQGRFAMAHGEDPRPAFSRAEAALQKAHALDPADAFACFNLGEIHRHRAAFELLRGRDPAAQVAESERWARRGLEVTDSLAGPYVGLAELEILVGEHRLRRGESPSAQVEAVHRLVSQALEREPEKASALRALGEAELLGALWRRGRGAPSSEALRAARHSLERAVAGAPHDAESYLALGRYAWRRLAGGEEPPGAFAELLALGRESAAKALSIHPGLGEAIALEGGFALIEACRAAPPDPARLAAARGRLEEGLRTDGNLEPRWGPVLELGCRLPEPRTLDARELR